MNALPAIDRAKVRRLGAKQARRCAICGFGFRANVAFYDDGEVIAHKRCVDRGLKLSAQAAPANDEPDDMAPEARRTYVGASDVPAICNLTPNRGAWSVWAEKHGHVAGFEGNKHSERGNLFERAVLDWFGLKHGLTIERPRETFVHPEFDILRCHLDGATVIDGERVVIEAKDTGSYNRDKWKAADEGRIGELIACRTWVGSYWVQVQAQLAITGWRRGYLVARCDTELHVVPVQASEEWAAYILREVRTFWDRYILGDEMPAVLGADHDAARKAWRSKPDDDREAVERRDLAPVVQEMREIRSGLNKAKDEAKARLKELTAQLWVALGCDDAKQWVASGAARTMLLGDGVEPLKVINGKTPWLK